MSVQAIRLFLQRNGFELTVDGCWRNPQIHGLVLVDATLTVADIKRVHQLYNLTIESVAFRGSSYASMRDQNAEPKVLPPPKARNEGGGT